MDPSLPAQEGIDVVTRWVARVSELIKKKGRVKAKRLESLVESLPSREIVQNRMPVTIANLKYTIIIYLDCNVYSVGPNEGKVVALKALVDVVRSNEPPGYGFFNVYEMFTLFRCSVMMDEEYTCIAVSIYHLDIGLYSKMTESDVFYFLDPYLKIIELPNGKVLNPLSRIHLYSLGISIRMSPSCRTTFVPREWQSNGGILRTRPSKIR